MEFKTCVCCKIEFPKNEDYFFKRVIKNKTKNGIVVYNTFRSFCKKCHAKKTEINRIKKRCEEMNCDISDYRDNWKKQYSETRTHVKGISNLPKGVQNIIRKKVKSGYLFTTYEKYRIDCRKNISKSARKYDYGDIDFVPKNTQTGIKYLTDGYIALSLGKKVSEVPKEIIETKRLIIKLKRELKK